MYADLIERVGKAEGADRNLDGAIYWHLLEENRAERELWWVELQFAATPENGDWRKPYTSSLDAALSLVERKLPGVHWSVSNAAVKPRANVWMPQPTRPIMGPYSSGATPALAVCLALLRALSTEA